MHQSMLFTPFGYKYELLCRTVNLQQMLARSSNLAHYAARLGLRFLCESSKALATSSAIFLSELPTLATGVSRRAIA